MSDEEMRDASSQSSDDVSSDEGSNSEAVEMLVAGRERRKTAGNRYDRGLVLDELGDEEDPDEVALLFADNDEEEDDEFKSDEPDEDAEMSSDDDDDQGPNTGAEDLEGEKELQKQAKEEKARKRKADLALTTIAGIRKKPKIDPTVPKTAQTVLKPSKRKERVTWLPDQDGGTGRSSLRKQTIAHRETTIARLKESEAHSKKMKALKEQRNKERAKFAPKELTQADRLAEAERVERRNAKSLNRWEAMERKRAEEQAARLAALKNRKLEGPVVSWWSLRAKWVGSRLNKLGHRDATGIVEGGTELKKRGRKPKAYHEQLAASKDLNSKAVDSSQTQQSQPSLPTPSLGEVTNPQPHPSIAESHTAIETQTSSKDIQKKEGDSQDEIAARDGAVAELQTANAVDSESSKSKAAVEVGLPLKAAEELPEDPSINKEVMEMDRSSVQEAAQEDDGSTNKVVDQGLEISGTGEDKLEERQENAPPSNEKVSEQPPSQVVLADMIPEIPSGVDPTEGAAQAPQQEPAQSTIHQGEGSGNGQDSKANDQVSERILPSATNEQKNEIVASTEQTASKEKTQETTPNQPVDSSTEQAINDSIAPAPTMSSLATDDVLKTANPVAAMPDTLTEKQTGSAEEAPPVIEDSTRNIVILEKFEELSSRARQEYGLFYNSRKSTKPTRHIHELCPITALPVRYRDPATGIGYANATAYKKLQELQNHQFTWSSMLGCYVGRTNGLVARGVPEGFSGT